ncbi:MAG TPA: 7-cyano-7-deazaguanine synthase [Candidatus Binatia bacterium]|nr:7-cyano-7-deazaguanine synthase [Candidatus Binatia bacterium]
MTREIRRCTRCVLPDTFPAISFDAEGVCSYCRKAPPAPEFARIRAELRGRIARVFEEVRGRSEYDCIVAYSGGKDSTYVLSLMVREYKVRPLAVTVDNTFLSPQAVANCRTVSDALGVDHMFFRPSASFLGNMYRTSLTGDVHVPAAVTRASAVCNSCINVINTFMVKLAVRWDIAVVVGGYIGGQVPKDAAIMKLDLGVLSRTRQRSTERYLRFFGEDGARFFSLPESATLSEVTVINPLLAVPYGEEMVLEKIAGLGWKMPPDTGRNSSNCRLNDLGILQHERRYGFNPYVNELAELVRHGLMDREVALRKVAEVPRPADLRDVMAQLAISEADLKG